MIYLDFAEKKVEKLILKRNFATCLVLMIYLDFAKKKVGKIDYKKKLRHIHGFCGKIGKNLL